MSTRQSGDPDVVGQHDGEAGQHGDHAGQEDQRRAGEELASIVADSPRR